MTRNKEIKVKDKSLNVKFPEDDYKQLQKIAEDIGGITLASMIRMLIYARLNKVRETGDPRDFMTLVNYYIARGKKESVINIKMPKDDLEELKVISSTIGITRSAMLRILIYDQLEKVNKSRDPKKFLKY